MNFKNELERRIEKERIKIIELKSQLDRAEAFVLGLQEALRLVPKDSDIARSTTTILRVGSEMAKVRDFLKSAGKPMYINDILIAIGKETTKANRENIGGSLGNYARRADIFTRTAPNTFGLVEFDNSIFQEEENPTNENTNNAEMLATDKEDTSFEVNSETNGMPEDAQKEDEVPW